MAWFDRDLEDIQSLENDLDDLSPHKVFHCARGHVAKRFFNRRSRYGESVHSMPEATIETISNFIAGRSVVKWSEKRKRHTKETMSELFSDLDKLGRRIDEHIEDEHEGDYRGYSFDKFDRDVRKEKFCGIFPFC